MLVKASRCAPASSPIAENIARAPRARPKSLGAIGGCGEEADASALFDDAPSEHRRSFGGGDGAQGATRSKHH